MTSECALASRRAAEEPGYRADMGAWHRDLQSYRPWGLGRFGFLAVIAGLLGVIEGGVFLTTAGSAGVLVGVGAIVSAVRLSRRPGNVS